MNHYTEQFGIAHTVISSLFSIEDAIIALNRPKKTPAAISTGVNASIPGCGINSHHATSSWAITWLTLASMLMPAIPTHGRMPVHNSPMASKLAKEPLRLRKKVGDINVPSNRLPAVTRSRLTHAANRQP